jgi:hypothetical protein
MLINYAYVTLSMLWLFDLISVENRIWGDGNGICRCDADGSRLLSGVMLEACGYLSYPNLRTGS